ncbi:hypothetical protein HAX54_047861 [Datura stramonium]|uniref:Uncharacterized protein n=1 Tax=Datura stramonium TaxID=4076 RepID=A0ABS8STN5_DATST|nr:hypothetical protein [Datura stramonium]
MKGRDLARVMRVFTRLPNWSPELAAACEGQENSMERWWFNSMLFKKEFERRCGLNKSMGVLGLLKIPVKIRRKVKNIHSWGIRTILVAVMLIIYSALKTFGISSLMTLFS